MDAQLLTIQQGTDTATTIISIKFQEFFSFRTQRLIK